MRTKKQDERDEMKRADVRVVALYGESWAVYGPDPVGGGICRLYAVEGYERAYAAALGHARMVNGWS